MNEGGGAGDELDTLQRHLVTMLGAGATFRSGQREAIEAVIDDESRTLVVQRTGWGKSLVYWIATRVRRDRGHGPTLIVSPLLALMRNQIEMAGRLGLRAVTINSGNQEEWKSIEAALAAGDIDVLLVSPQRFANDDFTKRVLPAIQGSIGLFVVDEAHCISDWGHEFVPDYRRIARILRLLGHTVPILATTATANDRVIRDVTAQLGDDVQVIRGPLARESLFLDAITLHDQAERLAWLSQEIPQLPGTGIVYCLTVADADRVAGWLNLRGIEARAYHASVVPEVRRELEQQLLHNRLKVLVATVALGMGFDKPDLGFVIHFQRPSSPIAYYQQVGRAGRAVSTAYGILLAGREDDDIAEYFLKTAFPPTIRMLEILQALERVESTTIQALEASVNLPHGQIDKALKLLELDGAVGHEKGRWFRTPNPWQQDEERIAGVVSARRRELDEMREYVDTTTCRMEFLTALLDDPAAHACGNCSNDTNRRLPREVDRETVLSAMSFLRRDLRPIESRKRWPDSSIIKLPNEPGLALSVYGDAGWGIEVKHGKYVTGRFSDGLVTASAAAITSRWRPVPPPEWVTAVPSRAGSSLVGDFAAALASQLGLPYLESLTSLVDADAQKDMQNSAQQAANARHKLEVVPSAIRPGAVLLVDDIADSRWTLTVAGSLLRQHGAGPVLPFVLALASIRDASG